MAAFPRRGCCLVTVCGSFLRGEGLKFPADNLGWVRWVGMVHRPEGARWGQAQGQDQHSAMLSHLYGPCPLGREWKYPSAALSKPTLKATEQPVASRAGHAIQWAKLAELAFWGQGGRVFIGKLNGVLTAPAHDPSCPGSVPRSQEAQGSDMGLLPAGGSPAPHSQEARCQVGTALRWERSRQGHVLHE